MLEALRQGGGWTKGVMAQLPIVNPTATTIREVVESIGGEHEKPTTIVVCCGRQYFLDQIMEHAVASTTTATTMPVEPASEVLSSQDSELGDILPPASKDSPLLYLSLQLLAASLHTQLAFCPSIPSFRAFVSTLPLRESEEGSLPVRIIVLNMLALHHGTSDFTVQGLSRTFALLASAKHKIPAKMALVECVDISDPSSPQFGPRLWDAEVPLLSGSIKIGEAGQAWAARRTSIKSFARRWFGFLEGT